MLRNALLFFSVFTLSSLTAFAEDIPMFKQGGVYHVPVTINNLVRLSFVVDSGASFVSIPIDVVKTLVRTGSIDETDLLGDVALTTATGEIFDTYKVNIRSLTIGTQVLTNVEATIVNEASLLLLGQSALNQLEPWHLDSKKQVMSITAAGSTNPAPTADKANTTSENWDVAHFIDEYIAAENSRDLNSVISVYNNRVTYYDKGYKSKDYILNDKKKYYQRWPSSQTSLINIERIDSIDNGRRFEVTYNTHFDVYRYSDQQGIKGTASNTLILKRFDNGLKIVLERQKITDKSSY